MILCSSGRTSLTTAFRAMNEAAVQYLFRLTPVSSWPSWTRHEFLLSSNRKEFPIRPRCEILMGNITSTISRSYVLHSLYCFYCAQTWVQNIIQKMVALVLVTLISCNHSAPLWAWEQFKSCFFWIVHSSVLQNLSVPDLYMVYLYLSCVPLAPLACWVGSQGSKCFIKFWILYRKSCWILDLLQSPTQ